MNTEVDLQGDGDAVLFVHGFPLDRTMWLPLASTLHGRFRIAPDLRTVTEPLGLRVRHGMQELADDLVAVLDALTVDRATVCALSMGGYVALEMVRRHADRLSALILCCTRAEADTPQGRETRDELIRLVRSSGTAAIVDRMIPKLLASTSRQTMPHVVDHVEAMITRNHAAGIIDALEAMKHRVDATALLPEIRVPALVIAGVDDQLIPVERTRAMAAAIPGARLALIPDAGHLAPLEQPIATSRVVSEFLESVA